MTMKMVQDMATTAHKQSSHISATRSIGTGSVGSCATPREG